MATDIMGLRADLLAWYEKHGVHPAEGRRRLGQITGLSPRQLEKVEQTGAFRYPVLLRIAMKQGAKS